MLLNVDLIKFRTLQNRHLLQQFDIREIEFRNRVQRTFIHYDFGRGIHAKQSAKLHTCALIAARIIRQTLFHRKEAGRLVRCAERRDLILCCKPPDQFVAALAVFQKLRRNLDRTLSGGDLEIDSHHFQRKILCGSFDLLLFCKHAVMVLLCIEESESEVQKAECEIHTQIVDIPVRTCTVTVSIAVTCDRLAA